MTSKYEAARPETPAGYLSTALGGGPLYSRSSDHSYNSPYEERIEAIQRLRERLDEEERQIAFHLRLTGSTWAEIARLWKLNSPQRAQQKFGDSAGLLDKLDAATGKSIRP